MPLQAGDIIGAYEIVGVVGSGGMASVYKAYHERLDRHVAIKFMHETFLQDEDFRARFLREARIVARLEHPNIVPIYDFDEFKGTPYLVMKLITGMTLKKRAIKTGLSLIETRDILTSVARGLDYAHEKGILHRDMKPSNILIDSDDTPYITDFGLARIAEAGASTISHDMLLGTPFYISPEQAQGEKDLDSRTDIYSLAVILYELITGRVPFQADTPYAIVHGHIHKEADPPSDVNSELNMQVDVVLARGLAKKPADRYPTANALIKAFGEAIESTVDSPPVEVKAKPASQANIDVEKTTSAAMPPVKAKAKPDYNDLGEDVLSGAFLAAPRPPHIPQSPIIPSPDKRVKVDAEFDMSNFGEWGERIRDGVTSLAEMIEERIDTELRQRRGIALTEEELARRRVIKKLQARREFIQHLSSYLLVNGILVAVWFFTGAGFFWPFFPLFFWGLGVAGQGYEYYSKFGPGASQNQAQFDAEVRRELARGTTSSQVKLKNETEKPKATGQRLSLDDLEQAPRVRLNDEGELTDSFIQEQRKRR